MAAEDDRDPVPDPWDEIVAEGLGDGAGEISFRFDEEPVGSAPAAEEPVAEDDAGAPEPEAVDPAPSAEAEDALVEDWLTEGDGGSDAVPPLSVFSPEDAASGSSAIDIATGTSGIALHGPAAQEEIGSDVFAAAAADADSTADEWAAVGAGESAAAEEGGFPDVAAGAAAGAVVATKIVPRPTRPAKKAGGIGQMIGVMAGGAMAIPITLAILIYGLGKDPFGVTKMVPREAAFLLPQKFRPGAKKLAAAGSPAPASPSLDDLPAVPEPAVNELPVGEPVADDPTAVEPAVDEPAVVDAPFADVSVSTPEPSEPVGGPAEPAPIPDIVDAPMPAEPSPPTDAVAVAAPNLDGLGGFGAAPAPVPAAPEPPPLDTAALDEAVVDAAALGEALGAVDNRDNRAYVLLRTRWYRALARVAAELVAIEESAAVSGRPLTAAPDNVAALNGGIGEREALAAELAALAPDWLAYAKRGSDGIVVPVTFESASRSGPFWKAIVSLAGPDGQPISLTVISRREPSAIAGDRVVVTGVVLGSDAIWAADVRGGNAGEPPASF